MKDKIAERKKAKKELKEYNRVERFTPEYVKIGDKTFEMKVFRIPPRKERRKFNRLKQIFKNCKHNGFSYYSYRGKDGKMITGKVAELSLKLKEELK